MSNVVLKSKKSIVLTLLMFYMGCVWIMAQNIPRTYVAHYTAETITVDGKMTEVAWHKAKWSKLFIDIEGQKTPQFETRVKMLWDMDNLYIYADLKEPHVWGTLKQKDTVIFYNNDFEVFIDHDGDTHNYYELEINALNTIWDLYLSKPYRNGAHVLNNWDIKGLRSAVYVNGTLNDPSDIDKGWMLEIAIPWSFTKGSVEPATVPKNQFWRINFSRVNWDFDLVDNRYSRKKDDQSNYLPENNWVWSPQGVVNMHEPEHWGYVYFSTDKFAQNTTFTVPQDEYIKWYLYELFRDYRDENKRNVIWKKDGLKLTTKAKLILGKWISPILERNNFGFHIWALSPFTGNKLVIYPDGKFESITDNK